MRKIQYGRVVIGIIFILAAGCFYSCSRGVQGEFLSGPQAEDGTEVLFSGPEGGLEPGEDTALQIKKDPESEPDVSPSTAADLTETEAPCFVHVCGEVESPGVYEMKAGQRVFEAIAMAGGFTEKAAQSYLNLAEPVWDGMKLEVPDQEQAPATEWTASAGQAGSPVPGGRAAGAAPEKVNLNTATKEELMTLRGIGEAKAEDIIRYREKSGGFTRIEDIMQISGIKNAAFEKIKDDITV